MSDKVLAWLSVWSEVQMICLWSSWCHCHRIISCFIKIQIGLIFLLPAYPGCPGKEAVKRVSACLCLSSGAQETSRNIRGRCQGEVHTAGSVTQDLRHYILPREGLIFLFMSWFCILQPYLIFVEYIVRPFHCIRLWCKCVTWSLRQIFVVAHLIHFKNDSIFRGATGSAQK